MFPDESTFNAVWRKSKNPLWPLTRLSLRRNLASYPFPHKLSLKQAECIVEEIQESLAPLHLFPIKQITPHQKELLFEHFCLSEGFENQGNRCSFTIDAQSECLGLINAEDHLHLHLVSFEEDLSYPHKQLLDLDKTLSKELPFAFSPRFGYVTANPSLSGTAFVVQSFLHLPALLHLEEFSALVETLPEDISLKGLGEKNSYLGDFVLLENTYTLGVSEESILQSIQDSSLRLIAEEQNTRAHLEANDTLILKDKIARNFGLLSNACLLETKETLSALSLVALGKHLGWIKNAEDFCFLELFFSSRRAHLIELSKKEQITKEELAYLRADHIRKTLSLLDPCELFL